MSFHVQSAAVFTRPADVNAYASGDLIANSTTAGSVAAMTFADTQTVAGASGAIRRCRLVKSGTVVTNASFRLHLYQTLPTVSNGDNGVWLTDQAAGYCGSFDITVDKAFSDGAQGIGVINQGAEINYHQNSGVLYGLLEARAAYTPISGETFTARIEVIQPDY